MVNVTRLTVIKFLELVLVCVLIGLHWNDYVIASNTEGFLATSAFGGYLIILIGLFAGGVMGTPVNRRVDLFFSLVGCALFIAAGSLIIDHTSGSTGSVHDRRVAKGSISIIEGIIFFIDAVLTFRGEA